MSPGFIRSHEAGRGLRGHHIFGQKGRVLVLAPQPVIAIICSQSKEKFPPGTHLGTQPSGTGVVDLSHVPQQPASPSLEGWEEPREGQISQTDGLVSYSRESEYNQVGNRGPGTILQQKLKLNLKKMNLVAPSRSEETREAGKQRWLVNSHEGLQQPCSDRGVVIREISVIMELETLLTFTLTQKGSCCHPTLIGKETKAEGKYYRRAQEFSLSEGTLGLNSQSTCISNPYSS